MPRTLLFFQHADWERPGVFFHEAARRFDLQLNIVHVYRDSIPAATEADALVLLGGPPNVHEEETYPFLKEEKRFLRQWLASDRPCLGFCLGHQLLADSLGASVGPMKRASIGFIEGHLTAEGCRHPVFGSLSQPLPLFKWHGQAVQLPLPDDLILLAESTECPVEAIGDRRRPQIIGVQHDGHAAHPDDVRTWLDHDGQWVAQTLSAQACDQMIQEAEQNLEQNRAAFFQFLENFLTLL